MAVGRLGDEPCARLGWHLGNRGGVKENLHLVLGPADDLDTAHALGGGQRRQELGLRDGAAGIKCLCRPGCRTTL